ncbi:MAG TPA: peptidoglycan-associated lipoprotein Pal [Stellaceae bacterium]|jgi:peptidoglycan-associated lipoprotein
MFRKLLFGLAALAILAGCDAPPETTSADRGGGAPVTGGVGGPGGINRFGTGVDANGGDRNGASRTAPGSQQDLAQNVGDHIYFETDRVDINPEARRILERQAEWLRRYSNVTVTLEGHADERGTREYNLALGERRAAAMKSVLVALGIDTNRLNTVTFGKERPEAVGSNPAAWAKNRRGVTVVN